MSNFKNNYNINNKNMSNILFRADSSSEIGLGHIMRDLVLASKYKNANITFAPQDLKGNINHKILEAGYNLEILKSNSKKELVKLIKKLDIDLLVIDHYKINAKKEKYVKEKTGVTILALDDTYEEHHCDILLNHNIGANSKKYKNLVPKNCELKCGEKYTLIRDEFINEKKNKTIFIAMGGADSKNISLKILIILKQFKNINVHLTTTAANSNIKVLKKFIKNNKNIKLHINSKQLAKLMKNSDFAIVSPSVIAHEVLYMNLPFIVIKTVKNQNNIYHHLSKNTNKYKCKCIDSIKKKKHLIKCLQEFL